MAQLQNDPFVEVVDLIRQQVRRLQEKVAAFVAPDPTRSLLRDLLAVQSLQQKELREAMDAVAFKLNTSQLEALRALATEGARTWERDQLLSRLSRDQPTAILSSIAFAKDAGYPPADEAREAALSLRSDDED